MKYEKYELSIMKCARVYAKTIQNKDEVKMDV